MKVIPILLLLLAGSGFAADKTAVQKALAACGPEDLQFDVKTDKHRHPAAQPDAGKATIYIMEDAIKVCLFCGAATTRVGMDGAWIGADEGRSYFFSQIEPGEHHLCGEWQRLPPADRIVSLAHFTAEAGKTYYFRLRVIPVYNAQNDDWFLDLTPIDSDEGQLLAALYSFSTWTATMPSSEPGSQGH